MLAIESLMKLSHQNPEMVSVPAVGVSRSSNRRGVYVAGVEARKQAWWLWAAAAGPRHGVEAHKQAWWLWAAAAGDTRGKTKTVLPFLFL